MSDPIQRVAEYMRIHHRKSMDELEITDTPGYWRDREASIHPGHPLHSCLGCSGPFRATYSYFDGRGDGGRFASPTRTWRAIREGSDA